MAKLAGKAGDVYVANYLLEDCEDSWTSGTNGTAAAGVAPYVKVGDGSAKCTITAGITAGDIIMYETMAAARDVSTYTHIYCWAYSTVTTALLDYRIGLGTGAAGGAPVTTIVDVPALTAATWKYCRCTVVSGSPFSATTVGTIIGLESNANGATDDVIYLDDVRAAKVIAGINSWNLDYASDPLETTDFVNAGVRAYIVGASGWTGSFGGYKDGAPLSIGSQYGIDLAESATATQAWNGTIIITGVHPTTGFDGAVSYSYDFQGTGQLIVASA